MFTILKKEMLAPTICLMEVEAPRVAYAALPGQFVIVRARENGERIPLTICDYNREKQSITLVTQRVGHSSRTICELPQGGSFHDVVGPLGRPSDFALPQAGPLAGRRFVFIAGGLGTAPVYPQAKYLYQAGAHVEVILGAKTRDLVIMEKEMAAVCHRLHICTDDGSYGFHGLVTARLKELLDGGAVFDQAVAIGPMIMMKFVSLTAKAYKLPLVVSLNTIMVDGTGMCGACRVTVGGQTRFACVDGPEFDAYQVDFDEALRRGGQYRAQEAEACQACEAPDQAAPDQAAPDQAAMDQAALDRAAGEHVCRSLTAHDRKLRVPVREQDPALRAHNFEEVCYGYNHEEAMTEAARCLQCKRPRCVDQCPVHIQIPQFIHQVALGKVAEAARILALDSSLPAVCGRVCPQETQCEGACVMGIKAQPVAIGKLERFVADHSRDLAPAPLPAPTGHKVAVIGSGPAGLACASDLAKAGVAVTVFEALHKPGGVLAYGIPEFRLPKEKVLAHEVAQVKALGVKMECNVVVGKSLTIDDLLEKEGFEAVFIGSGAGLPKFMDIPGENLNGVVSANEFLTRSNLMNAYDPASDTPIFVGRKVMVVGGGNVAMDAARTALRLGAEVGVIYRRTEKEMPARVEEVHHAKEEGVQFHFLCNPVAIEGNEKGWVTGARCIRMELGEPDASGRRRPVEVPGSEFTLDCDVVIIALGTVPNPMLAASTPGLETNRRNCVQADEQGRTTRPRVFAGGDAVSGAATVILAMGAGRTAASAILETLGLKQAAGTEPVGEA